MGFTWVLHGSSLRCIHAIYDIVVKTIVCGHSLLYYVYRVLRLGQYFRTFLFYDHLMLYSVKFEKYSNYYFL